MCNRPNRRTASRRSVSLALLALPAAATSGNPLEHPRLALGRLIRSDTARPPASCLKSTFARSKIEGQLLAHAGRISTSGTGRNRSAGTMPANGSFPRFPSRKRSFRFRPLPAARLLRGIPAEGAHLGCAKGRDRGRDQPAGPRGGGLDCATTDGKDSVQPSLRRHSRAVFDLSSGAHGLGRPHPSGPFVAGSHAELTLVYTAGTFGIDDTGMLKISWRTTSDMAKPQFREPAAPNYTTVEASNGAKLEYWFERLNIRPWVNTLLDPRRPRLPARRRHAHRALRRPARRARRAAAADQLRGAFRAEDLRRCLRDLRIHRVPGLAGLRPGARAGGAAARRSCLRSRCRRAVSAGARRRGHVGQSDRARRAGASRSRPSHAGPQSAGDDRAQVRRGPRVLDSLGRGRAGRPRAARS